MKKEMVVIVSSLFVTLSCVLLITYAYFRPKRASEVVTTSSAAVTSKVIGLQADYSGNLSNMFQNMLPISDEEAMEDSDGFEFSVTNTSNHRLTYKIVLEEGTLGQNEVLMNSAFLKINVSPADAPDIDNTKFYAEITDGVVYASTIDNNESQDFVIKAWIDEDAPAAIKGMTLNLRINLEGFNEPVSKSAELYYENQNALQDAIRCNLDYTDCGPGSINDLNTVIANNSESVVILTSDLEFNSETDKIIIPSGHSVVFDLNGYKITKSNRKAVFENAGNLKIIDSMYTGRVVNTYEDSSGYVITTTGYLIVEGGTYITNGGTVVSVGLSGNLIGKAELKQPSVFKQMNKEGTGVVFDVYSADSSPLKVLCTAISKGTSAIIDNNENITGTVKIYGGKYISFFRRVIYAKYTLNYNITPTAATYLSSYAGDGYAAITSKGTGTVNISATAANACTANPNETTSGLCVFANSYYDSHEDGRANSYALHINESSTMNVLGGTYNADKISVYNAKNGTMNIMNATIVSNNHGMQNGGSSSNTGAINMCNITFTGTPLRYDISAEGAGPVTYYSVIFSNGTQTPSANSIDDDHHVVTNTDHCPLTS